MGIDVNEARERGKNPFTRSQPAASNLPLISSPADTKLLADQNQAVTRWQSMVQRKLHDSATGFVHGKTKTRELPNRTERKLADSIASRNRKQYGEIFSVSFTFERHGVFIHKGVGRGYNMQGGMVVRTARSADPSTRDLQWWEEDARPRTPQQWFNPVLNQTIPQLADTIAEINADATVNATRMMIK